jgi:hypothetical protein
MLIRAYAAVIATLNLNFSAGSTLPLVSTIREALLPRGLGPLVAFAAISLLAIRRPRAAVYLFLLILYFAGATAIQFQGRHAYYLEFAYWLSLALLVAAAIEHLPRLRWRGWRRPPRPRLGSWLIPTGGVLVLLLALGVARAYQAPHVAELMEAYLITPRVPLKFSVRAQGRTAELVPIGPIPDLTGSIAPIGDTTAAHFYYLVATLGGAHCPGHVIQLKIQYDNHGNPAGDLSGVRWIAKPEAGVVQVFFPTSTAALFTGLLVPRQQAPCVTGMASLTSAAPLPLSLVLGPDWKTKPRFQRLAFVADWWRPAPTGVQIATEPLHLFDFLDADNVAIQPVDDKNWKILDQTTKPTPTGLVFDGAPLARYENGAMAGPLKLKKGMVIAARGEGSSPAIFGLIDHPGGSWVTFVHVPAGKFLAAVEVPADGVYWILVAHDSAPGRPVLIKFSRVGIVSPLPAVGTD